MNAPHPELRRLVDRLLDGESLDSLELERLEALLGTPEGLEYYLAITANEAFLPEALANLRRTVGRPPVTLRKSVFAWSGAAAAACLIFAAGWGLHTIQNRPSPPVLAANPAGEPARITGMIGVEWDTVAPDLLSTHAAARRLAIRSGLIELTYGSGVRVTLEGPADFTVKDGGAGLLAHGKLAASVPKGAEGFRVDYATGSVVDLGTEFAMDARSDGSTELGVFQGKVELHLPGEAPRPILADQALIHHDSAEERLQSIPLNREKFIRQLPSRDFRWEITTPGARELSFDVSHLIWKGSDYRASVKLIGGPTAVRISGVQLKLDGRTVVEDAHEGITGILKHIGQNLYRLRLPGEAFARGRWTLHVSLDPLPPPPGKELLAVGIVQLEEGLATAATATDFIGRWTYTFLGQKVIREFHADGRITITQDGVLIEKACLGSLWTVENGVLRIGVPGEAPFEEHILRDRKTLVFVNMPYGNAVKMDPK
jgi:hypothetical protein